MIKAIVVVVAFAVIGAALYYYALPIVTPYITTAIPQLTTLISSGPSQIEALIAKIKENWQLVAGSMGTITVIGGYVANWLHKRGLQKQEAISTQKVNEVTSQYFQLDGEKRTLENDLEQLQQRYATLKENNQSVATLTQQLEDKQKEIDALIAAKNELERILPSVKDAQRMIEEQSKIH